MEDLFEVNVNEVNEASKKLKLSISILGNNITLRNSRLM